MSAITGIFYRDGRSVDPELIKKMNNRLAHRGHDGSSTWCEGPVAFGHQMLFTTPESLHEKLPFEDEESGLVITADARIDNRAELSELLEPDDNKEVSDSLFILKAYEKWGEDCPDKLLGDFAFAIWDKNNEKLFCARDHMGVKPFYYYLSDDAFFFATEMKALFIIPEVPYKLNDVGLAFYLMVIEDSKSTFYKDIFSFAPAHSLTIDHNGHKVEEYWEIDAKSEIILDSEEEYIMAFREIFSEAVKCRLRSAFPIGFELSGGMDSSSIVSIAKKILNEDKKSNLSIKTFSIVYDEFPQSDERYYINSIINTGGIESILIFGDLISPLEQIETILWYQEQPFFTPFISTKWNVYKKMYENDVRINLGGTGGDNVISYGTNYLQELAFTFKWKKLVRELRGYANRANISFINLFFTKVFFPLIPDYIKRLRPSYNNQKPNISILNKDFAKRVKAKKYLKDIYWEPRQGIHTAKKLHHLLLNSFTDLHIMEVENKSSSAFSIESRFPFLDKRLIEFCYAIPTEMKFKFGWSRYILRVSMEKILPPKNQWRPYKAGVDPVYNRNLLFEKKRLENIIYSDNKIIKDFIDLEKLQDIYRNFSHGNNSNDSLDIWLVTLIFLWMQKSDISLN
ncbi:MAG: lasso peptide isopeptide bond-forming cyclase [Methanobacterium paludis]|nr:lasso peptide isopeptide bond-forming cyclase [Methanobacterium paludis]